MKLDKFLKILWLINGLALLILFCIAIVVAISEINFGSDFGPSYISVEKNGKTKTGTELSYEEPISIYRTGNYLMGVGLTQYTGNRGGTYMEDGSYYDNGTHKYNACVNVIFLDKSLKPYKTLLSQKAYIKEFLFPTDHEFYNYKSEPDSTLKNIFYLIALRDTNEDGELEYNDESDLYSSDLSGNNLRQITKGFEVYNYRIVNNSLLIEYRERKDVAEQKKFALYHLKEDKLEPLTDLDRSLNAIKTLYTP